MAVDCPKTLWLLRLNGDPNASNPELRRRVDCRRVMTCEDYLEQVVNVVRRAMAACGMVVLENQRVPVVRTSEFRGQDATRPRAAFRQLMA